jgi:predicted acylesterase/phospholipase RssA
MEPVSARADDGLWWLNEARVEGFVYGVFEGGGAKGVLYAGALQGLLRRRLWFTAVAGSSVGAITAAMIAAGMTPSDMTAEMDRGLKAMARPTAWSGLRRIRWGTGFLDHERVLTWLEEVLSTRCRKFGLETDDRGPTFAQLSELTGIDLFVAAVDLRARHLAVFNGALTPKARVAEAVMASATIPFAFEPRVFQFMIDGTPRWRLFVDGGVASNFPSFVFQDEGFRRYSNLDPHQTETPIVGFLLDEARPEEAREETRDVYKGGDFIGSYYEGLAIVAEAAGGGSLPEAYRRPRVRRPGDPVARWSRPFRSLGRYMLRLLVAVEIVLLTLVALVGRAVRYTDSRDAFTWRWKTPDDRRARLWVTALRLWLGAAAIPLVLGLVAYSSMFWFGFVVAVGYIAPDLAHSSIFGLAIGVPLFLGAFVLAAWLWFLGMATFLSLLTAYRSVGVLGADVLETYLNTSAPPWAGCGPNERVVHLTVPDGIGTLGISDKAILDPALAEAEKATFAGLEGIRGGQLPVRTRGL